MNRRGPVATAAVLSIFACFVALSAQSQTRPNPPPQICVNEPMRNDTGIRAHASSGTLVGENQVEPRTLHGFLWSRLRWGLVLLHPGGD